MLNEEIVTTIKKQVLVVGDGGVGKTSLIRRYADAKFSDNYIPTISTDLTKKEEFIKVRLPDGNENFVKMILRIYDIGGQSAFKFSMLRYAKNSDVFVICYDCTNYQSFSNVFKWYTEIKSHVKDFEERKDAVIIVATKGDLLVDNDLLVEEPLLSRAFLDDRRCQENQVPLSDLKQTARVIKTPHYIETSAKTGCNVKELFRNIGVLSFNSFVNAEIGRCKTSEDFMERNGFLPDLVSC